MCLFPCFPLQAPNPEDGHRLHSCLAWLHSSSKSVLPSILIHRFQEIDLEDRCLGENGHGAVWTGIQYVCLFGSWDHVIGLLGGWGILMCFGSC